MTPELIKIKKDLFKNYCPPTVNVKPGIKINAATNKTNT